MFVISMFSASHALNMIIRQTTGTFTVALTTDLLTYGNNTVAPNVEVCFKLLSTKKPLLLAFVGPIGLGLQLILKSLESLSAAFDAASPVGALLASCIEWRSLMLSRSIGDVPPPRGVLDRPLFGGS